MKPLIVIRRDHLDSGSVASPNRETRHGFLLDIGMTIWRVVGGFALAAVIAVPLGVPAGAYWAAKQVANSFATRWSASWDD